MQQENQIEVFKTTVKTRLAAKQIQGVLVARYPDLKVNFDLEDCDNVLRVVSETDFPQVSEIITLVKEYGHEIDILE